eukprot:TRINITY_DN5645_c0_g3_i1.p1 TRINITY_DN5645_c0_g3~~TRINITY_DN5645_c0_g3_i1.p1  ORF type:complete len:1007 (+),score=141.35 TRINITY_DN5645_c0_g3_i1:521-3541(+)
MRRIQMMQENGEKHTRTRHRRRVGQIILYFCAVCWNLVSGQDQCQVLLMYEAAIANGTASQNNQTKFVGRFTMRNNLNETDIESWRLAFQFTNQEKISGQKDMLTPNVSLITTALSEDVVMEWTSSEEEPPIDQPQVFRFLGHKDSQAEATVASIAEVKFSNLECTQFIPPSEAQPENSEMYLLYKSIETMVDGEPSSTQYQVFFLDIVNRSNTTRNLKDLKLQYFFEGGDQETPGSYEASCVDSKPLSCSNITFEITEGLPEVHGAQNLLTIGFTDDTGYLLGEEYASEFPMTFIVQQTGETAYSKLSLIVAIQSDTPFYFLTIKNDYSYVDAPIIGIANVSDGSQVSQRTEIQNNKIPVLLNGKVISGISPYSLQDNEFTALQQQGDNETEAALCMVLTDDESKVCSVTAHYCCKGPERLEADFMAPTPAPPPRILPYETQLVPSSGSEPQASPTQSNNGGGRNGLGAMLWVIVSVIVIFTLVGVLCIHLLYTRYRKLKRRRQTQIGATESTQRLNQPSQLNLMNGTGMGNFGMSRHDLEMTGVRDFTRMIGLPGVTLRSGNTYVGNMNEEDNNVTSPKDGGKEFEDEPLLLSHRRWQTMPSLPSTEWSSFTAKVIAEKCNTPEDTAMADGIHSGKTWNEIFDSDWELGDIPKMLQDQINAGDISDALLPPANLPAPVMLSSPMCSEVDLNVNFAKEIQPKLGRVLGSGGFGKVYEAEWKGQKVAVKVINEGVFKEGGEAYEALKAEVEMSCKISGQCDRVVRILGASLKDFDNMCIIMELVEGGSLADRIYNKAKRKLSKLEILQIAHDISVALAYLHPTIIHRDLKPQNILMDTKGRAKIADFGISRFKEPDATHLSVTQPNGTPSYMAPEMFNGTKVDEKCDVYSIGVILWECLTRRKPWNEHSRFAQIIMSVAIMGERLRIPEDTPPVLKRLIERCWDADPCRRPSTQEIMRNTEVYIQQELHSLQTRNPLKSRGNMSSSSSSGKKLLHGDRYGTNQFEQ